MDGFRAGLEGVRVLSEARITGVDEVLPAETENEEEVTRMPRSGSISRRRYGKEEERTSHIDKGNIEK